MNNYLVDALKESKTIILPGIGALTLTNATSGELMFMNFLKHDDGNLAKFIADKEGISENESRIRLAKHLREIEAIINKGETYAIYQLGSFKKNSAGEIIFEQHQENPAENREIQAEVDYKTQPEHSINNDYTVESTIADAEINPSFNTQESKLSDHIRITYSEEDQWNDDLDLEPIGFKKESPKKPILEKAKKDKTRIKPVFIIFPLVALTLGVWGFLFFTRSKDSAISNPDPKKEISHKNASSTAEKITESEAVSNSEEIDKQPIASAEITPSKELDDELLQVKPYRIIAGAFKNMAYAQSFSKQFESKNINPDIITTKFYNYVVLASFTSEKEAVTSLPNYKKLTKNVWMYKLK
jgi:nucleoid DNA-binding protein